MKASFLKHPATILVSVGIGVAIGLLNKEIAGIILIPGQIYLFYLQMTVIPIIITAIASSLGKLIRNNTSSGFIRRMCVVFLVGLSLTAVVGMAVGWFGKPGAGLDTGTRRLLTSLISSQNEAQSSGALEITLSGPTEIVQTSKSGLEGFLSSLIPSNIFSALALGSTMAVVFFSIVFGISIGFIKDESSELLINLLSSIFEAFQKLVSSSLYLLPFGLICLMAGQIAQVGVLVFMAMSKFIILYIIGTFILFIITTILIWVRSGIRNPFKVLSMLFEPIMLAFATRNSMATLPSAINSLGDKMSFDKTTVNLTLPLGMTLGRFGNIYYFAVAVFFVAQIYGTPIGVAQLVPLFFGVLLAGTATAGASGIVTLSVISIALTSLSLPVEAILVIFMAIDPIIDPFRTFYLVYGNIAATAMIAGKKINNVGTLTVIIRKGTEHPAVLYHDKNGKLCGYEIVMLEEIARRLKKSLNLVEGQSLKGDDTVDMIGGFVVKTNEAPHGLSYSHSFAQIREGARKMQLCFLITPAATDSVRINEIIRTLAVEKFLTKEIEKNTIAGLAR
jgi:proton glutamate symport protein